MKPQHRETYIDYFATLSELEVAVNTATRMLGKPETLWWRGQQEKWPLVPGVFRPGLSDPDLEPRIYESFRRRVLPRHDRCPPQEQRASWMFFMQHYRLPTRLLDWSESILVAALFAVEDCAKHEGDAVIWALDPAGLNRTQKGYETGPCLPHAPMVRSLYDYGWSDPPHTADEIVSVVGDEVDLRMSLQLSGFTLHCSAKPMEAFPNFSTFALPFYIKRDECATLAKQLYDLGIRKSNLFLGPEYLAREIKDLHWGIE